MRVGFLFLLGTALFCAQAVQGQTLPPGQPSDGQENEQQSLPRSHALLSLRIAHLLKLKADEGFIAAGAVVDDNQQALHDAYEKARAEISCRPSEPDTLDAVASMRELLCADISYRQTLIAKRVGFWGGVRTLLPEIPPVHLRRMRKLLGEFETLAGEMDAAISRSETAETDLIKMMASRYETMGQAQASAASREAAAIRSDANRVRFEQFAGRLKGVREQRALLQQYEAQGLAKREAAGAAIGAALVKAVTNAVGAPPWVIEAAKADSFEAALKEAAIGAVKDRLTNDPSFKEKIDGALSKVNTNVSELTALYKKGEEFRSTFNRYEGDLNRIGAVLREPTLDGILDIGTLAFDALPEDKKAEWRSKALEARPILQIAAVMSRPDQLGERLKQRAADFVASQVNARNFFSTAVQTYLKSRIGEASSLYGELLRRAASQRLSDEDLRLIVDSFVRSSARWIIAEINAGNTEAHHGAKQLLFESFGVTTDLRLEQELASRGISRIPRITLEGGSLRITGPKQEVLWQRDIIQLLKLPSAGEVNVLSSDAERELKRLAGRIADKEGDLRNVLVSILPFEQVEAGLRQVVAPGTTLIVDKVEKAWQRIVTQDSEDQGRTLDAIASMQLGTAYITDRLAKDNIAKTEVERSYGPLPPEAVRAVKEGQGMENELMARALDAACPGLGVAAQMGKQVIDGIVKMEGANAWLDMVRALLSENFVAEARLQDLGQEAKTAEEIAIKEAEVHTRLEAAFRKSLDVQVFGLGEIARTTERNQTRVKIRRGLVFLLAERLREEFDLLNHSIALWGGLDAAPRGTIARLIREDPQNARLALDSEIQIYEMLNREGEGARTGTDQMLVHWRQILRLAEDACARIGCETETAGAQVRESRLISVCDLISADDARRFSEWQKNPSQRLRLRFFLDPSQLSVPVDQANHRIIEVRVGGKPAQAERDRSATPGAACRERLAKQVGRTYAPHVFEPVRSDSGPFIQLRHATLTHPGVSYVLRGDGLADRESLLLRRGGSLSIPEPFNVEDLRSRWYSRQIAQRGFFEGYSPFTEWELALEPDRAATRVEDVFIRVAYQYNDPINIVSERDFIASGEAVGINPFTYELSWHDPDPHGLDSAGRWAVLKVPTSGSMPVDPRSLFLLSSVRQALLEQAKIEAGQRPSNQKIRIGTPCRGSRLTSGASAASDLPTGEGCWGLANTELRVERICKSKSQLALEIADFITDRKQGNTPLAANAPLDLRRRAAQGETFALRHMIDLRVERLWNANKCGTKDGSLLLVGAR